MSTWELGAGSWAPPERAGGRRPRYDVPAPRRLNGARHAGGAGKGGERAAGERPGGGGQRGKAGAGAGRAQTPASPEARQRRWQSCRKESRPGRAAEAQMAGRAPDRRVAWRLALGAQFTRARGQCRHLVSGRRARPADADTGAHRATHDNHRMPGRVNRRIPRIPQRAPSAAPTSRGGADAHEVRRLEARCVVLGRDKALHPPRAVVVARLEVRPHSTQHPPQRMTGYRLERQLPGGVRTR